MSLQWQLIAMFVYAEVATVLAMLLPLFSVQRWRRILRSRLLRKLDAWGNVYFNVFLALLVVQLVDAWRKWSQYSQAAAGISERENAHGHALARMRRIRAENNFHLAGGALLLWVVLKWMVRMLVARAFVEEDLAADRAQIISLEARLAETSDEVVKLKRQLLNVNGVGGDPQSTDDDARQTEKSTRVVDRKTD